LPRTFTRDQIPSWRDQIPRPEIADKWPHLRKIRDSILPYQEDLEIGLLISCNCPKAIKPKEVILGKGDDPYAVRSILGWGIIGPVGIPATDSRDKDGISTCNRIVAHEIGTGSGSNLSFVLQSQTKEKLIPVMVQRMFKQDFSERTVNLQGLSSEDRRFLSIAEEGIRHLENGHYELPLPIKKPDIQLPNNQELAVRRLNQLKRKLMSDERYRQDYLAFMDKMFKQGYAERIPETQGTVKSLPSEQSKELDAPSSASGVHNVWYIPHHGVYHPKKLDKIGVVFDCGAEFRGESLNKNLLQGLDLTNSLAGVLCRFRENQVGFICDIESMFYQVSVREDYRDYGG